ncbi:HD domain-containing protein [Streptomyces sp. NPDC050549]|uniref:HD domain-containing protein n=1 Tax=Streptomyces sp. NPDC050549 TaxID=3155406 RepID=UPI00341A6C15
MWHAGQRRRSGDPYITHCLAVAAIVAELRMPPPVVCAALLHDVEDTACPPRRIADQLGQETADLIAAVRTAVVSAHPQAGKDAAFASDAATPSWERAGRRCRSRTVECPRRTQPAAVRDSGRSRRARWPTSTPSAAGRVRPRGGARPAHRPRRT